MRHRRRNQNEESKSKGGNKTWKNLHDDIREIRDGLHFEFVQVMDERRRHGGCGTWNSPTSTRVRVRAMVRVKQHKDKKNARTRTSKEEKTREEKTRQD
jgi:hypothetical protein